MTGTKFTSAIKSGFLVYSLAGLLAVTGTAAAQDAPSQPHLWRRATDSPAQQAPVDSGTLQAQVARPNPDQGPPPPPNYSANQSYPNQSAPLASQQQPYPAPPRDEGPRLPASLTIRPGTYLSVRVDEFLSSDHNHQGDTFFASLAEPLVVDGVVVAQRGQTIRGRVTDSQKAGRVEGTSKLGIELTGLTLVDGQQVGIHSRMIGRSGGTSVGRDAGAIGATTGLGALIGAGVDGGSGAAIGAGAGAAAGLIGVLLTRGHPTVIEPESQLTFEIESPVTISTERAPLAFRYADAGDYGHGGYYSQQAAPRPVVAGPPLPVPVYRPYYYSPYYSPYYWGPGFSVYVGPRYSYGYGGHYYYRGGYGGYRGYHR